MPMKKQQEEAGVGQKIFTALCCSFPPQKKEKKKVIVRLQTPLVGQEVSSTVNYRERNDIYSKEKKEKKKPRKKKKRRKN
jgi:hypothetical protein